MHERETSISVRSSGKTNKKKYLFCLAESCSFWVNVVENKVAFNSPLLQCNTASRALFRVLVTFAWRKSILLSSLSWKRNKLFRGIKLVFNGQENLFKCDDYRNEEISGDTLVVRRPVDIVSSIVASASGRFRAISIIITRRRVGPRLSKPAAIRSWRRRVVISLRISTVIRLPSSSTCSGSSRIVVGIPIVIVRVSVVRTPLISGVMTWSMISILVLFVAVRVAGVVVATAPALPSAASAATTTAFPTAPLIRWRGGTAVTTIVVATMMAVVVVMMWWTVIFPCVVVAVIVVSATRSTPCATASSGTGAGGFVWWDRMRWVVSWVVVRAGDVIMTIMISAITLAMGIWWWWGGWCRRILLRGELLLRICRGGWGARGKEFAGTTAATGRAPSSISSTPATGSGQVWRWVVKGGWSWRRVSIVVCHCDYGRQRLIPGGTMILTGTVTASERDHSYADFPVFVLVCWDFSWNTKRNNPKHYYFSYQIC